MSWLIDYTTISSTINAVPHQSKKPLIDSYCRLNIIHLSTDIITNIFARVAYPVKTQYHDIIEIICSLSLMTCKSPIILILLNACVVCIDALPFKPDSQ